MNAVKWICPACGRRMLSEVMVCGGSFLDSDHPPNVKPVAVPASRKEAGS